MNDLLMIAIPLIAFVVLFTAWIAQNSKSTSKRPTAAAPKQTVHRVSNPKKTADADKNTTAVPASSL